MDERLLQLEKQNSELLSIIQSVKDVEVAGWLERGFILPTELRARIQGALASSSEGGAA